MSKLPLMVQSVSSFPNDDIHNSLHTISKDGIVSNMKLAIWVGLWYFLTVIHNISTKSLLIDLPLPILVSSLNLVLGVPLFLPILIYRRPKFEKMTKYLHTFLILGCAHCLGHGATIYSIFSGSVSFTHVIKSAEPIFAAALSAILLHQIFPVYVYCSLLPIVIGVSLASADSSSFSALGFITAMISNFCFQLRSVLAKTLMPSSSSPRDNNFHLSAANVFRILTLFAAAISIPICLLTEGRYIIPVWKSTVLSGIPVQTLLVNICISSVSFYLYNEVSFWILGVVLPITHSIGNCLKRIVIIIASSIILRTHHSVTSIIGCTIAVIGALVYSITQHKAKEAMSKP
jgi:solute carrier family 35 protein E1